MSEIRAANLVIRTQNDKISFEIQGSASNHAVLDYRELPLILEFFNSFIYSQTNRRTGFRIELAPLDQYISKRFNVSVKTNNEQVPVRPMDISTAGIYVKSEQNIGEPGKTVSISLSYDDMSVELPAVIIRQNTSCTYTAFRFTGVCKEKEFAPPPQLQSIFHSLEALWLEKSLNLEWPH